MREHSIRSRYPYVVIEGMEGRVISHHKTSEAAEKAIKKEMRAFKKKKSNGDRSYLPRQIILMPSDGKLRIRAYAHSTEWTPVS